MDLPPFQTGHRVEPDGAALPYVTMGSGAAGVVVVPGAADGLLTCVDVAIYLAWFYRLRAQTCRILVLSRRDPLPPAFGVERHADDMIRTVEQLEWGPAVWECGSAAGPIGQWLAVKRPDLVQGLILSSSYDHVAGHTRKVLERWLDIVTREGGADFFWSMIEPKYRPPEDILARVTPDLLPTAAKRRSPERLQCILKELLDLDQRDLVPRIVCPTMIVAGGEDRVVPPEQQRQMAARIPNSRVELCQGYGHFIEVENPAYEQFVQRFVASIAH